MAMAFFSEICLSETAIFSLPRFDRVATDQANPER